MTIGISSLPLQPKVCRVERQQICVTCPELRCCDNLDDDAKFFKDPAISTDKKLTQALRIIFQLKYRTRKDPLLRKGE
jgi:hypothetical protein